MQMSGAESEYLRRVGDIRQHIANECAGDKIGRRTDLLLARLQRRLAKPIRVAFVGEMNGGKTTLANRLLDCDLLTTNVVHNTRVPILLKHALGSQIQLRGGDGCSSDFDPTMGLRACVGRGDSIEVGLELEALQGLEIVDSPGATLDKDSLTQLRQIGGAADILVWCTIATQAWRATEIANWRALGARKGRRSILAITHADLISQPDRERVLARVEREAAGLFDTIALVGHGLNGQNSEDGCRGMIQSTIRQVHGFRRRRAGEVIGRFLRRIDALQQ